jgi:hypothetical protein
MCQRERASSLGDHRRLDFLRDHSQRLGGASRSARCDFEKAQRNDALNLEAKLYGLQPGVPMNMCRSFVLFLASPWSRLSLLRQRFSTHGDDTKVGQNDRPSSNVLNLAALDGQPLRTMSRSTPIGKPWAS